MWCVCVVVCGVWFPSLSDINVVSTEGLTAMDYAIIADNGWVKERLSQHGAEPSGKDLPRNRANAPRNVRHPPRG